MRLDLTEAHDGPSQKPRGDCPGHEPLTADASMTYENSTQPEQWQWGAASNFFGFPGTFQFFRASKRGPRVGSDCYRMHNATKQREGKSWKMARKKFDRVGGRDYPP